jgi:Tfp pilus assembly protein PilF
VARQAGRTAEAEAEWRAVLALDSAYTAASLNLGLLYSERGAWAEAEAHYRGAIRFNPFYGRAYYNLGLFLLEQGRPAEAASVLERAAELTSGAFRARALNNLGRARLDLGDLEAARDAFTDAIALKPDYIGARLNLATAYPDTDAGRALRRAALAAVERLRATERPGATAASEREPEEGPDRDVSPDREDSPDSGRLIVRAD